MLSVFHNALRNIGPGPETELTTWKTNDMIYVSDKSELVFSSEQGRANTKCKSFSLVKYQGLKNLKCYKSPYSIIFSPIPLSLYLDRQSFFAKCFKWLFIPIDLTDFFPHYGVKSTATLICKHQTKVIIIFVCVYVDCTIIVNTREGLLAWMITQVYTLVYWLLWWSCGKIAIPSLLNIVSRYIRSINVILCTIDIKKFKCKNTCSSLPITFN